MIILFSIYRVTLTTLHSSSTSLMFPWPFQVFQRYTDRPMCTPTWILWHYWQSIFCMSTLLNSIWAMFTLWLLQPWWHCTGKPQFPWLLLISPTFQWPVSNSLLPGFPGGWPPCSINSFTAVSFCSVFLCCCPSGSKILGTNVLPLHVSSEAGHSMITLLQIFNMNTYKCIVYSSDVKWFFTSKKLFFTGKKIRFIFNRWPVNYKFYNLQVELHVIKRHLNLTLYVK